MRPIAGQHHVSMFTKNAQENVHFYRDVLGLRFVKKTVNQDDPFMYHHFYGDAAGSPGTELTFFELPMAGRTHRGTNAITRIGLLVPNKDTLSYWKDRFETLHVIHGDFIEYAGKSALPFQDHDGLQLLLISNEDGKTPSFWKTWDASPVPFECQIQGIGPAEVTVRHPEKTRNLLVNLFGYHEVSSADGESIFQGSKGKVYSEIVIKKLDSMKERPGRGSVHHLAIRVEDETELTKWAEIIKETGFKSSGIIDRHFFKSLYFRESNGILFELATDGPGFQLDETNGDPGQELFLPPFLEAKRTAIEEKLIPIK